MNPATRSKAYYSTTPIHYVIGSLHIGSALTTLYCDMPARYQRMRGREMQFITGIDEQATKCFRAAAEAGRNPMEFVTGLGSVSRRPNASSNSREPRLSSSSSSVNGCAGSGTRRWATSRYEVGLADRVAWPTEAKAAIMIRVAVARAVSVLMEDSWRLEARLGRA